MGGVSSSYVVGTVYNRVRDIHEVFGGQRQGGISTPAKGDAVFIFTSDAGQSYGYLADGFRSDGAFWYTGEGQLGDMQMIAGNRAIRDHLGNGKSLLLFEYVRKAYVRYVGEFEYLSHHFAELPDRNGNARRAIVFELGVVSSMDTASEPLESPQIPPAKLRVGLSLAELRAAAIKGVPSSSSVDVRQVNVRRRSEAVKRYALKRARGKCEGCSQPAPFMSKAGPFLEVHHVHRLGDGGPDHPAAVIALCPNCHRRAHGSLEAATFNQSLVDWLDELESGGRI